MLQIPDAPPGEWLDADGHLYVFAYGSLIWRPGFAHGGTHPALLRGLHRRFCLWSHRYRGTPERPGLVLGLAPGGACRGLAYRVPAAAAAEVLAYLDERELPDGAEQVYHRRLLRLDLLDAGRPVRAVGYVANRGCRLYCGGLSPERAAAAIAAGHGQMGPNRDYLLNTVLHLRQMGVQDAGLDRILRLLPGACTPRPAGLAFHALGRRAQIRGSLGATPGCLRGFGMSPEARAVGMIPFPVFILRRKPGPFSSTAWKQP